MVISFLIPCYGSENTIEYVIEEIKEKMTERIDYDYEIITINDQSPDNVLDKLYALARADKRIKVINLAKNVGKESAMLAGYRNCSGDIVIHMDDDGQCPIDRLWDLIEPLNNGYDVSIAKYFEKKQSLFKNFGSKMNELMTIMLLGKPKSLKLSNFGALKKFVVDEIIKNTNPFPYSLGIILKATSKIANVKMNERERIAGKGNFTLVKSLSTWLNGFTAYSVKPLRFSSLIGVICAIIGFVFGIVTVIRKIIIPDINVGWSSTVAIMLFIGGMVMLMLGLIGEYIGRIYILMNYNSQYVISDKVNFIE